MYHLRVHFRQSDLFPAPRKHLTFIRTDAAVQTLLTRFYGSKGSDILCRVGDGVVEALTSVCKKVCELLEESPVLQHQRMLTERHRMSSVPC